MGAEPGSDSRRRGLRKIFLAALAIRVAYTLANFAALGPDGLVWEDSRGYLEYGVEFTSRLWSGELVGWDWLGPALDYMPLHLWLTTAVLSVTGTTGPLAPVLLQGAMDAGNCVVIACLAGAVDRRLAIPAGWFAAFNPTLVVMAGLLYADSLFLLTCTLALFAAVAWLDRSEWRWAWLLGAAFGLAALTRALILPWAVVTIVLLGLAAAARGRLGRRQIAQLAAMAGLTAFLFAPVLARNYDRYDTLALTTQGGGYVLVWLVPLTMEVNDGTPRQQGVDKMYARLDATRAADSTESPFDRSARMISVGLEALWELGPVAIAKSWAFGAAINLASPAIIQAPALARLPRTGFYATPGETPFLKLWNFMFGNQNPTYTWLLIAGCLGVAGFRAAQLYGLAAAARRHPAARVALIYLILWIGYILVLNGPIASPKYRLPLEPVLAVFFAFAWISAAPRIRALWRSRSSAGRGAGRRSHKAPTR